MSRNLVILLDGTSNQFDDTNTNVVKLCSLLQMHNRERQMVYYQPGIGTFTDPGVRGTIERWFAKTVDLAIAWYLSEHVMDAYKFLMENHLPNDRICIFGFSRGAYTARALAGMLHTVGLLPKGNSEQVSFAYDMYHRQDKLAHKFKMTFCKRVDVEILGVWDTVASVGLLIPQTVPFASNNTIKNFRHAISLDEHRTKFGVTPWSPTEASGAGVEQYANGKVASVKEMWFSGCHTDVGGGAMFDSDAEAPCLANIALRWMLHEIVKVDCGILFDNEALDDLGIPEDCVPRVPEGSISVSRQSSDDTVIGSPETNAKTKLPLRNWKEADEFDAKGAIHDQLKLHPIWWLVQIPVWTGKRFNFTGRRTVPSDALRKQYENIHWTVLYRMNAVPGYKPRARLPSEWQQLVLEDTAV